LVEEQSKLKLIGEHRILRRTASSGIRVRRIRPSDFTEICSWVRSRRALEMVSSNVDDGLTQEVLCSWVSSAEIEFVAALVPSDRPIGFCTLSRKEASLDDNMLEFCHQILNPWNISFIISYYLCEAARSYVLSHAFRYVVTRTLTNNKYAITLAQLEGMTEITESTSWAVAPFKWFSFEVKRACKPRVMKTQLN
jgi:hypothetical protein